MKKLVEICDLCGLSCEIEEKDFNTASIISRVGIGFIDMRMGSAPIGESKEICVDCKNEADKEFHIYIKNSKYFEIVE